MEPRWDLAKEDGAFSPSELACVMFTSSAFDSGGVDRPVLELRSEVADFDLLYKVSGNMKTIIMSETYDCEKEDQL